MRPILFLWILFGLLFLFVYPVRAEFEIDKITMKLGSDADKEMEEDLYCYSNLRINKLLMEFNNRLSRPRNNINKSKFNLKTYLEDYEQLKLVMDYQWNERFRFFSPEINYKFTLWKDLKIRLDYENQTRTPVSDEDRKMRCATETGTIKMDYGIKDWNYTIKLSQTQKDYPEDEVKNYDKNQLDQKLTWRIRPNLKLLVAYFEATSYYPYDININQDYWKSETSIEGKYRINDQWQVTGFYSAREEEKGLVPYLNRKKFRVKIKNNPLRDLDLNFQVGTADIDYYMELPYYDPDDYLIEDDDKKSRVEKNVALECCSKFRKLNLTVEAGLFCVNKQYESSLVEEFESKGMYNTLCWNSGKFGIELEIAPDGNLWRRNGFYQLKMEYRF